MENNKRQKSKDSRKSKSKGKENTPKRPKLKPNINSDDAIGMSKQLAIKKKTQPKKSKPSKSEVKLCPNGKPMPSLADLEKMYEDSDEDDQSTEPKPQELVKSPETNSSDTKPDDVTLPCNMNKIVEKMMDIISNMPIPPELSIDTPPPPVVPPKKKKKSDIPYIVGCKDRPQVIKKPNTNFCKGDSDYGVEKNTDPEEEPPKKRKKKSKIGGFSKSVFNAQSDDIAERLKAQDTDSLGSLDSGKTVAYDVSTSFRNAAFSPLPSTSRDSETFIKNDKLFNESLLSNNTSINNSKDNIDVSCETIVLDDQPVNFNSIEIKDPKDVKTEDIPKIIPVTPIEIDDDCCVIVDSPVSVTNEENKHLTEQTHHSPVDDEYSQIDLDTIPITTSDNEIIDVDSLIAENAAIINRMPNTKRFDSIIEVFDTPNTSEVQIIENTGPSDVQIIDISNNNNEEIIDISDASDLQVANSCRTDTTEQCSSNNRYDANLQFSAHNQLEDDSEFKKSVIKNLVGHFLTQHSGRLRNLWPGSDMKQLMDDMIDYFQNTLDYDDVKSDSVKSDIVEPTLFHFLIKTKDPDRQHESEHRECSSQQPVPPFRESQELEPVLPVYSDSPLLIAQSPIPFAQTQIPYAQTQMPYAQIQVTYAPTSIPATHSPIPQETTMGPENTSTPKQRRSLGDCPICMDSLSNLDIASTICGHVFCLRCIRAAIRARGKRCPTCRKILKGAGYHQLFI